MGLKVQTRAVTYVSLVPVQANMAPVRQMLANEIIITNADPSCVSKVSQFADLMS